MSSSSTSRRTFRSSPNRRPCCSPATRRSRSRSGSCRRSGRGRTILWPRRTARSGTRECSRTSWAASIRGPAQIKEYPLKTPQSGPHGLTVDKDGKIWFTANSKGYIGKLDPATGEITEYKLPEAARDPHTPLFDSNGMLWFSVQGGNMAGRLDPKTGDVKVVTYPQPRSLPYGMVFTSKGVPDHLRIRREQNLADRSGHHGDQRVGPAERRFPAAPDRDHQRRRRLVRGLFERLPWTSRYRHRGREGVAVAGRPEVAALRHHGAPRRDLVQRICGSAQHAGAVRSQDREVPDAGSSLGAAESFAT